MSRERRKAGSCRPANVEMKVFPYDEVQALEVEGAPGVTIRWVINERTGAPNFAMRVFEVEPGAATPYHRHWYEQEMFILEGTGLAIGAGEEEPVEPGRVLFVPPYDWHQIKNTGTTKMRFICVIPLRPPQEERSGETRC